MCQERRWWSQAAGAVRWRRQTVAAVESVSVVSRHPHRDHGPPSILSPLSSSVHLWPWARMPPPPASETMNNNSNNNPQQQRQAQFQRQEQPPPQQQQQQSQPPAVSGPQVMQQSGTGQQQQQQQYSIPGILSYLQYEWQRFELERQQWTVERAELQARISLLQGQLFSLFPRATIPSPLFFSKLR